MIKYHDQLKFHDRFQVDDFISESQSLLAKEHHVHFIALTLNDRPMFIGEIWQGKTGNFFFDFHVRPAGGELDLKYYYYYFLYKVHEFCLEKPEIKILKLLRNSLFEQSQLFGYQVSTSQNFINYSHYKNIGEANLESISLENKRTTV